METHRGCPQELSRARKEHTQLPHTSYWPECHQWSNQIARKTGKCSSVKHQEEMEAHLRNIQACPPLLTLCSKKPTRTDMSMPTQQISLCLSFHEWLICTMKGNPLLLGFSTGQGVRESPKNSSGEEEEPGVSAKSWPSNSHFLQLKQYTFQPFGQLATVRLQYPYWAKNLSHGSLTMMKPKLLHKAW